MSEPSRTSHSRRGLRVALRALGALAGAVAGIVGYAHHQVAGRYPETPLPPIRRAEGADALARGEKIFESSCAGCHVSTDGAHWALAPLSRFLSAPAAPNITADPRAGIGGWSDEELARLLRFGVRRDGSLALGMPWYGQMGDADVAAVIAFLRSGHAYFAPNPRPTPRPSLTLAGTLYAAFVERPSPRGTAAPIPVPRQEVSAEYGRYMANAVYLCFQCHTEGTALDKPTQRNLYGGGMGFRDPEGGAMYSKNLTPDPTGIGGWTFAEFTRAVRDGLGPDGFVVRSPMQRWRFIDNEEMEAIFTYLRTLPKVSRPDIQRPMHQRPLASADPHQMFLRYGCRFCHGSKPPFDAKLQQSAGKPASYVARWIRNPQSIRPGTQMPTYAEVMDESQALQLAEWLTQVVARP